MQELSSPLPLNSDTQAQMFYLERRESRTRRQSPRPSFSLRQSAQTSREERECRGQRSNYRSRAPEYIAVGILTGEYGSRARIESDDLVGSVCSRACIIDAVDVKPNCVKPDEPTSVARPLEVSIRYKFDWTLI